MKLKVVKAPGQDPFSAVKMAVIMSLIANAKVYELLHKQIWRKDPNRLLLFHCPFYTHHNGRPIAFVQRWNIKSQYTEPYSYSVNPGDDPARTFGLNQLFVGQNPREPYQGDPKDGIYHEECYIQPKAYKELSGMREKWVFVDDEYIFDNVFGVYEFYKQDEEGNIVITAVTPEVYNATVGTAVEKRCRLVIMHKGTPVYYELGKVPYSWSNMSDAIVLTLMQNMLSFTITGSQWQARSTNYEAEFRAKHGNVVFTFPTAEVSNAFLNRIRSRGKHAFAEEAKGKIQVYADGTVIEYVPHMYMTNGDGNIDYPAHYKVLPMIYLDTGDLTMPISKFVEEWDDMFELIVLEDSEWWESLVAPVIAIVAIVLSVITAGAAAPAMIAAYGATAGTLLAGMIVLGGVVSALGVLSGEQSLILIGGVMGGIGGLAATVASTTYQAAMAAGLSSQTALQVTAETSLGGLFSNVVSGAGLGNILDIGSNVLKVFSGIQGLGVDGEQQTMAEVMEDAGKTVIPADEEEEGLDAVMSLVNI